MNLIFSKVFKLIGGLLFMAAGAYILKGTDVMFCKIFYTSILCAIAYGFMDLGHRAENEE